VRARQPFVSAEFREATQGAGTAPRAMTMADELRQVPAKLVHASDWHERALPVPITEPRRTTCWPPDNSRKPWEFIPADTDPPGTSRTERGTYGGTPVRSSGANPAKNAGPPAACGGRRLTPGDERRGPSAGGLGLGWRLAHPQACLSIR
jgi:hypothetical protein